MRRWMQATVLAVLMVGAMISGTTSVSHAAGFYNYSNYTVGFEFVSEGCPWLLRWTCLEWISLDPGGGSWSSNNRAGWVVVGGDMSNTIKKDGRIHTVAKTHIPWVDKQGWMVFNVVGNRLHVELYNEDGSKSSDSFDVHIHGL